MMYSSNEEIAPGGNLQDAECEASVNSVLLVEGYTALHCAVEGDNEKAVNLLLSKGVNTEAKTRDGRTSLHIAVERGSSQIVKHLLDYGASVNSVCASIFREGYTPLHFAVEKNNEEVTRLLLNRGAKVNAKGNDGITPLHIVSDRGNLQIAEHLLKSGADVNPVYVSAFGDTCTPLSLAVEKGREKVVKLLLEYGASVNNDGKEFKSALHLAAEKGYLIIVDHILKHFPDVNNINNKKALLAALQGCGKQYRKIVEKLFCYGFTISLGDTNCCELLYTAIQKGYLKIIEHFLKTEVGFNMLRDKKFLLHVAAKNGQEEIAKLLINYGAEVNAEDKIGRKPIFYSVNNSNLAITKLLLASGTNIKNNFNLLNIAVQNDCKEIIDILLRNNADINACDERGRTALHFTILCEDDIVLEDINEDVKSKIIQFLISEGADINAKTIDGFTVLRVAVERELTKVVATLLDCNAEVNSLFDEGVTLLHFSAEYGNTEITKMLLSKGINVNAQKEDGKAALHVATQNGYKEVVELLLNYGARVDFKTENNAALHIAAENGYSDITKLLLTFGSDVNLKNKEGLTALHIVAQKGHSQVVKTLLEYGSDINILSKDNNTPLDCATISVKSFYNQLDSYDSDSDFSNFNEPYDIFSDYEITAEVLKRYVVKMKVVGLYVHEKNLLLIRENELRDFQRQCENEIEMMLTEKIGRSNITFYDILTSNLNRLVIYVRND